MSFYIKSFNVTPLAHEINDAIPDETTFLIQTNIVCRRNANHDKYFFTYSVNDTIIAESDKDCSHADEDHVINDSIEVVSSSWGNGNKSNVDIKVTVIQDSCGAQLDESIATWVES